MVVVVLQWGLIKVAYILQRCQIILKVITHQGTGEMAQGLRALASLTKDKSFTW